MVCLEHSIKGDLGIFMALTGRLPVQHLFYDRIHLEKADATCDEIVQRTFLGGVEDAPLRPPACITSRASLSAG